MNGLEQQLLDLVLEALQLALLLCTPPVLAALAAGLLIGVLQAATQLQDQTLAQVPKIIAVYAALVATVYWNCAALVAFTGRVFELIGRVA